MDYITIPTCLTLLRMIMVPFFIIVFYLPVYWSSILSTIVFFIAAITDWLDGFLARRWQQITNFGKFLDPVADKILVVTALILVSEYFHVWWITLPTSSIIIREIIILALREWIVRIDNGNSFSVSWISKIKTCAQMLSMIALLWRSEEWIIILGVIGLYIAVVLTLWSMCSYLYDARYILFNR